MGKTKTKTQETATVAPNPTYTPYINDAANALKPSFQAAQVNNQGLMQSLQPSLDYTRSVLAGDYLYGNPYLQGEMDRVNEGITDQVNGQFEGAGRYGSGMHAGILAKQLAQADNSLLYQNYAQERAYQNQAPGQLTSTSAFYAALPQLAAGTYADQVGGLLGKYTQGNSNSTTTQSPSVLSTLLQLAGTAAQTAGSFGGA